MKVDTGDALIDLEIYQMYVTSSTHVVRFKEICDAIDSGGGQTCDVNGVLKALDKAGYRIVSK